MNRFIMFAIAWFILSAYGFFMKPPSVGVPLFPHFDKFTHFTLFFGQFWLVTRAYREQNKTFSLPFWASVAFIWAATSELIQSQLPSRSADVWDVVADFCGAVLALYLGKILERHQQCLTKENQ